MNDPAPDHLPENARTIVQFTPAILVVDDEVSICNAIRRELSRDGVVVHSAHNAEDALRKLADLQVQVVVSDLSMPPGPDGIALLTEIRSRWPRVQRVLLSGYAELEDALRAINVAGVHRFLSKPWAPRAVSETVLGALEQWRILEERDQLLVILEDHNRELEAKVRRRTAAIERASEAWRQTFDAIADPLILINRRFEVTRANTAAAAAASADIRALNGRKCHDSLFGRDEPCELCPLRDGARPPAGASVEMVDARTGQLWKVTTWPVSDGATMHPEADVTVCQYEDITVERERELQVIALEKTAAVGELASVVAHEIRNPLTAINTFSQVILRNPPRDEQVAGMVQDILDETRRCQTIVQSLADYSRPVSPGAHFKDLDLTELLETCLRVGLLAQATASRIEIRRDYADDLARVRGNGDSLKSLFLNLINNAVQAMEGQGILRVETTNVLDQPLVRVLVADSGPGVPVGLRDKIFKPFYTTKADNKSGTGLGLAIVRNAVRDHGGSITVGEGPDGGASFAVELPALTSRQVSA